MSDGGDRRSRLTGMILLGVVFVAGVGAGVAADRLLVPRPTIRTRLGGDMWGVLDRLSLTPQQRTAAEAIVRRSTPRAEAMILEVGDRLRAVADSVDSELWAILTPAQQARLDSLRRKPKIILKRAVRTPGGGTAVDTLYPPRRDSAQRP